jgi:hypothetical protein
MSTNDQPSLVDEPTSKEVNRKMDIALLPFLSLLYLLNGLDRSNVGNAETQGKSRSRIADHNNSP